MLRFFVETLSLCDLREPALLARVARCADGLVLAVRPGEPDLTATVTAVRAAGLAVTLWPMLDDAAGRWCTLGNAAQFLDFARECMRSAPESEALLLDLEPPWRLLDALAHLRVLDAGRALGELRGVRAEPAESRLGAYVAELVGAGIAVHTAEFPWALAPPALGRAFGVPHVQGPSERGVMLYTSMLEGYAGGLLGRAGALGLLRQLGARALARLGPNTELQLGAVGCGALENEPVYRNVGELEADLDAAQRLGARRVAVFELGGILRRPDAERWLSACARARHLLLDGLPRSSPRTR